MSDYFVSEIEPIFEPILGMDYNDKKSYKQNKGNGTKTYYFCEKCDKKGRVQKECCGRERTKGYIL